MSSTGTNVALVTTSAVPVAINEKVITLQALQEMVMLGMTFEAWGYIVSILSVLLIIVLNANKFYKEFIRS